MRLVDIDKSIESVKNLIRNGATIEQALDAQPTAYDPEEVVKQLEAELIRADEEKERCSIENPLQFDSAKGYAHGIANAIEIVKGGFV